MGAVLRSFELLHDHTRKGSANSSAEELNKNKLKYIRKGQLTNEVKWHEEEHENSRKKNSRNNQESCNKHNSNSEKEKGSLSHLTKHILFNLEKKKLKDPMKIT